MVLALQTAIKILRFSFLYEFFVVVYIPYVFHLVCALHLSSDSMNLLLFLREMLFAK
ncbi:hypothetical protein NHE_0586 [Neorickettsia helminthoeca str. Oregon]|uniref:Uncharacterized protein n=1 Tax=Neorickettsia helminthoeca str. Oregon TaxID=1286528 RepID=X5HKG3_9RICK|nr:hypothetical protein NHE_0586 [Neorickettsia helminthoeca str. Oregon]